MAIDPICGMTVDEPSALRAERDGHAFYFCGNQCRQKFLSTPATAKHEDKPQGKAILYPRRGRVALSILRLAA
jgi:YHS domain-containing protein